MDKLKKRRSVVRTSFSKTSTLIQEELNKENASKNVIKDKFTKLEGIFQNLKDLDEQCLDILLDSASEDDILKENECCEVYLDDFITLSRVVQEYIGDNRMAGNMDFDNRSVSPVASIYEAGGSKSKCYKLPKLELSKFDGQFINWIQFWMQFEKIDADENLDDGDKFRYLAQCMEPQTPAQELLNSYPMSRENYPKVIQALKDRFGKKELLIEVYVRELIEMIIGNVKGIHEKKYPLSIFYDKIEAQLRSLESLGLKTEENAVWLYPMVESCLSEDILKAWQRSTGYNTNNLHMETSPLNKLLLFLKSEVEGEEKCKLARTGLCDFVTCPERSHLEEAVENNEPSTLLQSAMSQEVCSGEVAKMTHCRSIMHTETFKKAMDEDIEQEEERQKLSEEHDKLDKEAQEAAEIASIERSARDAIRKEVAAKKKAGAKKDPDVEMKDVSDEPAKSAEEKEDRAEETAEEASTENGKEEEKVEEVAEEKAKESEVAKEEQTDLWKLENKEDRDFLRFLWWEEGVPDLEVIDRERLQSRHGEVSSADDPEVQKRSRRGRLVKLPQRLNL